MQDHQMYEQNYKVNPKIFNLWLFLGSVVMIFAGFTSAYIVRRAEGNWLVFDIPDIFIGSTIVIVLSSIVMHMAYLKAKKDDIQATKLYLGMTSVLGIAFMVMQVIGWNKLVGKDIYLVGVNPSASFFYVLTFVHALHLLGAVIALFATFVKSFRFEVHSRSTVLIEGCMTLWHFLGILWIYLFLFLKLYR